MNEVKAIQKKINGLLCDKDSLEALACYLLLAGLFVFPIHIRYSILQEYFNMLACMNVSVLIAAIIFSQIRKHQSKDRESHLERWLLVLWGVALVLLLWSNYKVKTGRTLVVLCNGMFPLSFLLYQFERDSFQRFMKRFLMGFDIFIVILLVIAFVDKFCDDVILKGVADIMSSKELMNYVSALSLDVWRFYSPWGHALTNALFFNIFFILNDCYYRSIQKKYPKLLYFVVALLGVLLCASKTAIVVLILYLVFSDWKNKKRLLIYVACGGVVMLAGGFNMLIQRFQNHALTSGRMERLIMYFQSGQQPLGLLHGYGTNAIYKENMEIYKAGFEFPLMMYAYDYGIIFAVIIVVSIYAYVSYHALKKKQILMWIGYTLLYAQVNTYNGISLYNQDVFIVLCVFSMLFVNSSFCVEKKSI